MSRGGEQGGSSLLWAVAVVAAVCAGAAGVALAGSAVEHPVAKDPGTAALTSDVSASVGTVSTVVPMSSSAPSSVSTSSVTSTDTTASPEGDERVAPVGEQAAARAAASGLLQAWRMP